MTKVPNEDDRGNDAEGDIEREHVLNTFVNAIVLLDVQWIARCWEVNAPCGSSVEEVQSRVQNIVLVRRVETLASAACVLAFGCVGRGAEQPEAVARLTLHMFRLAERCLLALVQVGQKHCPDDARAIQLLERAQHVLDIRRGGGPPQIDSDSLWNRVVRFGDERIEAEEAEWVCRLVIFLGVALAYGLDRVEPECSSPFVGAFMRFTERTDYRERWSRDASKLTREAAAALGHDPKKLASTAYQRSYREDTKRRKEAAKRRGSLLKKGA